MNFLINNYNKLNYKKQRNLVFWLLILATGLCVFLFWKIGNIVSERNLDALSSGIELKSAADAEEKIKQIEESWRAKLSFKEREIERLNSLSSVRTVALIETQIVYRDTGSLVTVVKFLVDSTAHSEDSIVHYPVYSADFSDDWMQLGVVASHDSIKYSLSVRDSLLVLVGRKKQGFLKPRKPTVSVFSQSPYSRDSIVPVQYVFLPKKKGFLVRIWNAIFNK